MLGDSGIGHPCSSLVHGIRCQGPKGGQGVPDDLLGQPEVEGNMPTSDLLRRLQENPPGSPLDWRKVREEIHDEHERAVTSDERATLLQIFGLVMDLVERQAALNAEDLKQFRNAREADYRLLIVKEALVGENVCTETLDVITPREDAAGRMTADHELP